MMTTVGFDSSPFQWLGLASVVLSGDVWQPLGFGRLEFTIPLLQHVFTAPDQPQFTVPNERGEFTGAEG